MVISEEESAIKEKNLEYEIETVDSFCRQAQLVNPSKRRISSTRLKPLIAPAYALIPSAIKEKNLEYEIETGVIGIGFIMRGDHQREESRVRD